MLQTSEICCLVSIGSQGCEIRFCLCHSPDERNSLKLNSCSFDGFKILTLFLHSNKPAAATSLCSLRSHLLRSPSYSNWLLECREKAPRLSVHLSQIKKNQDEKLNVANFRDFLPCECLVSRLGDKILPVVSSKTV